MSWAKEEWKQGLTANVMKNVFDLEQRCETLQKESKQRQFQMESLQAALAKQKKVTEDEKANALSLKKENHSLSESIQELERSREKNLHDLNAKEGQIRCLDGKLSRSQQMLEAETASNLQLKNDLDHLQHDQNQLASKFEKQAADFSKLKEANIFLKRQLAGHKEQVRVLENQLKGLGEVPNSRSKTSSSGSDSEIECLQSGQESKLKELQASLDQEREQRRQIENELCQLKASTQLTVNTKESLPSTSEVKDSILEVQLQSKIAELATANEKIAAKDSELQEKIKELREISECFYRKENEVSEITARLTETSKTKSQLDEANAHIDALEKRAKQRELDLDCQRHNSEAVIKGMDEKLKEKEKEHREELHSQSQAINALEKQRADLEKTSSTLQNKLDNSQKMIEAKEHDIVRLKASLSEAENRSNQQNSHLDNRFMELQQNVKEQQEEYIKIKQELDETKLILTVKESTIADLNRSIKELSHTIQEKEKELSFKQNEIQETQGEDVKKLALALDEISLLKKQKADMEIENQKTLQRISDEATTAVKELELERQEVIKLKERVVYLENVVARKERESQKSEDSYKMLCEKLEAAETDRANSKVEWAKEKTVWEEKERSLQSGLEVMKNDSKAMQHDYKKACELADLKSAETTDLVDKLESSQKHVREVQQRLSRTEAVLKEKESSVTFMMQEKEGWLKEQKRLGEEAEKKKEELEQLRTDRKTEIEKLKEVLESANMKLDASVAKCTEKESEIQKLSTTLENVESRCQELHNSLQTYEENLTNSKEMVKKKEAHIQEVSVELESKDKVLCEMQQQNTENLAKLNELEQMRSFLKAQKDEDLKLITSKDEEIATLVKELNEIQGVTEKKLAEINEQSIATRNEVVFLQENKANLETLLQNREVELTAVKQESKSCNEELALLQQRLASQEELVKETGNESAKLIIDHKQMKDVLATTKAELDEVSKNLRQLQSEHQSVLDRNAVELEQLKKEEASLKERLEQVSAVAESKTEELKTIATRFEGAEAERLELSSMLDELCNTNFKLEDQVTEKTGQLEKATEVIKTKDEELLNQSKLITTLEKAKAEDEGRIKEQCSLLEGQLSSLQERCSQLEVCIENKNNEVSSGVDKIQQLNSELLNLQGELASKGELIEGMEREKAALAENLQCKTTALENKERELKDVSDSLTDLKRNGLSVHETTLTELETIKKEAACVTEKLKQSVLAIEIKDQELENLRNQLQIVDKEKQDLSVESQELHDESANLTLIISKLQNNVEQRAAAIDMKDQEVQSLTKQLQIAQEEKETLGSETQELHDKNAVLEEKIAKLQNDVEQMSSVLKGKEEELLTKSCKLKETEASSDQQMTELAGKCSAQESKLAALGQTCAQLEACIASKNEELGRTMALQVELSSKMCTLQEVVTDNEESMKGLEEERNSIQQKFEQQQVVLEDKDAKLKEICERLKEEKDRSHQVVECHQKEVDDLKNELVLLREKIEKLNVAVEMKDQDVESMCEQLQLATEEKKALTSKLDELTVQCKLQEEKNVEMVTSSEHLSNILRSKNEELAKTRQEIEELHKNESSEKISDLQSQNTNQGETIALLQEKYTQLESVVQSKQLTVTALEANVQELTEKVCQLQEQLAESSDKARKAQEENDALLIKLDQSSTALRNKEKQLKESLELLEDERSKQQSESDVHSFKTESLKEEVVSLSERLEKIIAVVEVKDQEIMAMIQKLKTAEEEKAGLGNKLDEQSCLSSTVQEKNTDLENKLEQISKVLKTSQEELTSKCHLIEELQTGSGKELAELKEQDEARKSQMSQLEEKCTHLEACIDSKESELNDLRYKIEASGNLVEVQVLSLTEKLENTEVELKRKACSEEELTSKLANRENQLRDANNTVHQHREDIRQLETQKEMLQMDLDDKDSFIESLNQKVNLLEGAALELKKKVSEKEESNDTLRSELEALSTQLTANLSNEKQKETKVEQLMQNIQTLEAQLLAESKKSGTLSEELQSVQENLDNKLVALEKQGSAIQELSENKIVNEDKVSKLQNQLDVLDKTLTKAQSDRLELEQLLRTAELKHEEDNKRMEEERESKALEQSKLLRQKSEECSSALEQLEKSKKEIERLKETVVLLDNVSTSKDQEKMKIEESYEALSEKMQKREDEFIRARKDLEEEKSSLLEKSRDYQAAMEALKHECKVYQQDYKKACELADLKGQDYRDVVDKLDDSQKHLLETRHQLSRAEKILKEVEDEKHKVKEEKAKLSEQLNQQKEEFEARIEELRCEICTGQDEMSRLRRQAESSEAIYKGMETEKHKVEQMLKHANEELCKAEEKLKSFVSAKDEREVMGRMKEESEKMIGILQDQVQSLETSKGELKSNLEDTKKELTDLQDALRQMESQHTSVMALKDSELDETNRKLKEKEKLANGLVEKLQGEIDCFEGKFQDAESKIADLLSEKQEWCSLLDKKTSEVAELSSKNTDMMHACEELKRAKESLEERLASQNKELAEVSVKKGRLEEEVCAVRMELEITSKQSVDDMKKHEEDNGEKDKELEKLQNLLKARCSQVEKLQRNLSDQTETLESFKYQVSSLTEELATLKAKHEQCQQRDDGSRDLEEQIVQLKHSLLREQSNNEAMMNAFQEQERQWEEEKTKILSSLKNGPENAESLIAKENVSLKRRLDDLQRDLNTKEQEHAEILQQKERRASSAANVKLDLETKIRALESQCEELKYKLVQKDEEIFEKDECLKKTNLEVSRLEAKYVAAEEVERELRHHLGEVTQQLEWSKENNSETVLEGYRDEETDQHKLKDALIAANKELSVLRAEKQEQDLERLENERREIVEAAKQFALQQEERFSNKIENLEHKLSAKNDELQEMESVVQQLRHGLKTIQQEKNVLIEAADERDREHDAERKLWSSGSYSYEKIQQFISDLEEERQNVSQLQEKCSTLEEKLKELSNINSSLQKNLSEIQKEKKLDNEEREVREDDLYSKVDLLKSESDKLEEESKAKEVLIASLTNEKAKLVITITSLEEKLQKSTQVVAELQQQCDLTKEQFESLRIEKGHLQEEKDASLMQKSEEKFLLENSTKKLRELEENLQEEVKEKNKLANTLKGMEKVLAEERECLKMKTTELAEIKTILKLADKENEESVKEKETRVVELTFAYEELRNKVIEEGKKFEGKCKELEQVKKQLKQAQEKSEEMKEDYERELDRIKFELKDSNNDCKLLQDENEGLKHNSTRGADQVELIQENKKLLFQLEESKLRFNHAKRRKEELESELDQANLKVISLESKGNLAGAEEIKRLKNQINELNIEIQKWKGKANKEQIDREDISHKDREINELRREVSKLQEEVKRLKAQAKEKIAEKNLENLHREKVSEPPSTELGTIGKKSNELNKSNSSRVNEVKAVSNPGILLSPLAKSLSNLDIKSLPMSSSQPAATKETSSKTSKDSQPLTQNDKDTKAQGVATGRGITKPSGVVDSKKRPGEQATESNLAKRSRLTNYGQAGMPKADCKEGNANIPGLPVQLSSTQLGRTTGVKTRSAAKRNVQAMRRENPESTRVQPRAQFAPPEMPLSPRKTNMSNIPQGPRTKIPKPGRSQVPRPAESHIPAPSARQRKPRGPLAPRESASKPAGDQPECKMQ